MEYEKIKDLNKKIVHRATEEIEKDMITKNTCDMSDMKILSMAIDNIKDIMKIEERDIIDEDKTMKYMEERRVYEPIIEETDFTYFCNKVIEKHGMEAGYKAIMAVITELMEDLKILNNRMYTNTLMKIKDML